MGLHAVDVIVEGAGVGSPQSIVAQRLVEEEAVVVEEGEVEDSCGGWAWWSWAWLQYTLFIFPTNHFLE